MDTQICCFCCSPSPSNARLLLCGHAACLPCLDFVVACARAAALSRVAAVAPTVPTDNEQLEAANPTCDIESGVDELTGVPLLALSNQPTTIDDLDAQDAKHEDGADTEHAAAVPALVLTAATVEEVQRGSGITCPRCYVSTRLPTLSDAQPSTTALPVVRAHGSTSTHGGRRSSSSVLVEPRKCCRKKCDEAATVWCKACARAYCRACYDDWHDDAGTAGHEAAPLDTASMQASAAVPAATPVDACASHGVPATLFCVHDGTPICDACGAAAHALHARVPYSAHLVQLRARLSALGPAAASAASLFESACRAHADFRVQLQLNIDARRQFIRQTFGRARAALDTAEKVVESELSILVEPLLAEADERVHTLRGLCEGEKYFAATLDKTAAGCNSCSQLDAAHVRMQALVDCAPPHAPAVNKQELLRHDYVLLPTIFVRTLPDTDVDALAVALVRVAVLPAVRAPEPPTCTVESSAQRRVTLRWEFANSLPSDPADDLRVYVRLDAATVVAALPVTTRSFQYAPALPLFGEHSFAVGAAWKSVVQQSTDPLAVQLDAIAWSAPTAVYVPMLTFTAVTALSTAIKAAYAANSNDPSVLAYAARLEGPLPTSDGRVSERMDRCHAAVAAAPDSSFAWTALGAVLWRGGTTRLPPLKDGAASEELDASQCYVRAMQFDERFAREALETAVILAQRAGKTSLDLPPPYSRRVTFEEAGAIIKTLAEKERGR